MVVRIFARHLQTLDPATEVPPEDVLPHHKRRIAPYLYSPQEIAALIEAAGGLTPPLRAATWQTLIGLLAVTGMRKSEACRLDRDQVDLDAGVAGDRGLQVRQVPPAVPAPVHRRRVARLRTPPRPLVSRTRRRRSFFVSTRGTRLDAHNITHTFAELRRRGRDRRAAGTAASAAARPAPYASRSPRCWTSTATAVTSKPGCRCCRPGSGTSTRSRRTGICRPSRNCSRWPPTVSSTAFGEPAMSALAPILQGFFTDKLIRQRQASPNTIAAYRDTCRLLLEFASRATGIAPDRARHRRPGRRADHGVSDRIWRPTGPTRSPPATPGWPRSAPCSATPRCAHPNTPTRSAGCWASRPNAATAPSCAS